ncbi:protein of unknown function [Xenorhabdus poinarii G6]|uniref:Uncharacterized protein n=1 Tax=Xenorhabdus poinarii G6 TaxID=1354304 RepID=A0A068R322_9GAMM|nr:protein of unknown function [Xenorhabdus poinarii G6]
MVKNNWLRGLALVQLPQIEVSDNINELELIPMNRYNLLINSQSVNSHSAQ